MFWLTSSGQAGGQIRSTKIPVYLIRDVSHVTENLFVLVIFQTLILSNGSFGCCGRSAVTRVTARVLIRQKKMAAKKQWYTEDNFSKSTH